jgi:GntR family transcriptional repressor for pyruvate dehydrogenase complex
MPQALLPNLSAPGLVQRAVEALRARIVAGAYGPDGALPPQGQLCRELGVSRSVVREAMQQLQSLRLVAVSQGRRPRVLPTSSAAVVDSLDVFVRRSETSLLHLAEVRLALEAEIAAHAAQRALPEQLASLDETLGAMERTPSLADQVEADIRFHRLLAEATGNPLFPFLLDALAEMLRASRLRTIGRGGIGPALAGHREILQAIRAGQAEAARAAMAAHVRASMDDLRRELQGAAP